MGTSHEILSDRIVDLEVAIRDILPLIKALKDKERPMDYESLTAIEQKLEKTLKDEWAKNG